tara:strand:+ start:333 stop:989 length:657 start_codon:yes stop_codon:yes gene_type:complete
MIDLDGVGMTSQRSRNRLVEKLKEMGVSSEEILATIKHTPRHYFIDEALASRAYENHSLPIGHGQTISQPYMVARMTEMLYETGPMRRVLEIGAGCGYQTTILSRLSNEVYCIERIEALVRKLRSNLFGLKVNNVRTLHADGFQGWSEKSPFDAILVAAAPLTVPEKLLGQLDVGGRLIIPVGEDGQQELKLIKRGSNGFHEETLEKVSFVPLLNGVV